MSLREKIGSFKKGQKLDIFQKGLVHGFCPKIELSLIAVFFTEIMSEKNRFSIFWIENNHFKTKKIKF